MAGMPQRQIFEAIVAERVPLAGEQTPEDIGNLAVFLSSDEARMITAQWIAVDGGISMGRS
jgi:enoyl-[acyl-carrier-protein] reductase (NADH)